MHDNPRNLQGVTGLAHSSLETCGRNSKQYQKKVWHFPRLEAGCHCILNFNDKTAWTFIDNCCTKFDKISLKILLIQCDIKFLKTFQAILYTT